MTDRSKNVWVAYGTTESGDDWGPYVWFKYEPTREEIEKVLREDWPGEFEDEEEPTINLRKAVLGIVV